MLIAFNSDKAADDSKPTVPTNPSDGPMSLVLRIESALAPPRYSRKKPLGRVWKREDGTFAYEVLVKNTSGHYAFVEKYGMVEVPPPAPGSPLVAIEQNYNSCETYSETSSDGSTTYSELFQRCLLRVCTCGELIRARNRLRIYEIVANVEKQTASTACRECCTFDEKERRISFYSWEWTDDSGFDDSCSRLHKWTEEGKECILLRWARRCGEVELDDIFQHKIVQVRRCGSFADVETLGWCSQCQKRCLFEYCDV